jgi:MFS family permease
MSTLETTQSAAHARVSPWLVLGVVFLASVAAVMAQFAAPPIMPALMEAFGLDLAQASSLMSVFSITGVLLALPAGLLLMRFGPLAVGATASGTVVVGSILSATTTEYGVLLAGRAVQGMGIALVGVTAPAVVAAVFPPERRGTPMGIWAMWVPVGGLIMYLVVPTLAAAAGWAAAWWLAASVAAVALVAWVVVLAAAGLRTGESGAGAMSRALADLRHGLSGTSIWLLVLTFLCFGIAGGASNTFLATFLVQVRGMDMATAGVVTSLSLAGMAVGSVVSGLISDRVGSRRLVYTVGLVLFAVGIVLPYTVEGPALPLILFVYGMIVGAIPATIFASVPEAVPHPRFTGSGLAGLMLGQNLGFVIGPVLFAALLPALGWATASAVFGLLVAAAAVAGWRVRVR